MRTQMKALLEQVQKLPADDQIELADFIYAGTALPREIWEAAWAEEGEKRLAEFDRGETTAIDSEVVFANLKEKFGWK